MEPISYVPVSLKLPAEWVPIIDILARKEGHNGRSGWLRGVISRELELFGEAAAVEAEGA